MVSIESIGNERPGRGAGAGADRVREALLLGVTVESKLVANGLVLLAVMRLRL